MTTPMAPTTPTTFTIDGVHSSAEFAVKHLMISTVRGRFRSLEGTIVFNEDSLQGSSAHAVIETASIDTGVEGRDADLRSANYIDVEKFPEIRFESTAVERRSADRYAVTGALTIRDVTKTVVLDTELEGRGKGMQGEDRIGFTATTALSRKDFGLTTNPLLETGGVVISDAVKVTLHLEAFAAS
ncbi:MAG: YceI family protein [Dehalococcoidia bacterium]|nr:YceI family protein [Dehalococcoidia bacterium]